MLKRHRGTASEVAIICPNIDRIMYCCPVLRDNLWRRARVVLLGCCGPVCLLSYQQKIDRDDPSVYESSRPSLL